MSDGTYNQAKYDERLRNDPRSIEELLPLAMAEIEADHSDKPMDTLATIEMRGTEAFEVAKKLCRSEDPEEKSLGATILGQNVVHEKDFPDEKFDILFDMLEKETDPDVLQSVCFALGHIRDSKAIDHVLKLKDHPSEDVRYGVVFGLLTYQDERAIEALIELTRDVDPDVRDWATFGIGSQLLVDPPEGTSEPWSYLDTPEIREALAARLDDEFEDARLEAIAGLALRKDRRALEPLRVELEDGWDDSCAFEAAAALRDPSLLPALKSPRREEHYNELLEEAIQACGGEKPEESPGSAP